ncbi:MAG: J domain-containing protein [Microbispora sp.]|nr:J domain-containing protein [Microbispora sp.]
MSEAIQAFPLQWPVGWRRTEEWRRERAKFGKTERHFFSSGTGSYMRKRDLSVADGVQRVLEELGRMGVTRDDVVIITNIPTRLDGLPRSDRTAVDPGVAVYWRKGKDTRCMAIDRYDRVQDNLAAIAATIEAMRAIERHGGATILDRAFQGFTALPAPESWWQVLGLSSPNVTREQIEQAHRSLIMKHHPDRGGGDTELAARINRARDQGLEALS